MKRGILMLAPQTRLAWGFVVGQRSGDVPFTPRHSRFVTRALFLDLGRAVPWVPFLALVPGSALVFLLAATKMPVLLPSTFVLARHEWEEEAAKGK